MATIGHGREIADPTGRAAAEGVAAALRSEGSSFPKPACWDCNWLACGAGAGALSGSLADYGIPDDFIRMLGETIPDGLSALFVLFKSVTEDKVLPEILPYKPRVLKTSLSTEAEAKLRAALSKTS